MISALLVFMSLSAPAPLPRTPHTLKAGEWVMEWNGHAQDCHLGKDGRYSWGSVWKGVWRWDPKKRTLYIIEWTNNPEMQSIWTIPLDHDLQGQATPYIKVQFRRK